MKTARTPALLLGLLYLCFFGGLALTKSSLPTRVATHFDSIGQPNGWMSPSAHLRFITLFGIGFPMFVPLICYIARFLPPQCHNIPHRDYWMAPAHRGGFSDYLFRHSLWFASMALGFVIGIHFSIVQANNTAGAHLSPLVVLALAGAFLTGAALWGLSMFRHFNHVA